MTTYATEGHPELDEVCQIEPRYEKRFNALTYEQRHNIALSIEANVCEFFNDQYAGKPTVFATERETIEAAAEGQLVEEERQA